MIHCSECHAELKYPVFISGIAYGSDCASRKFGIHIPDGMSDATQLVTNKTAFDGFTKSGFDLFQQHKDFFSKVREVMKIKRVENEWEYNFLLNMMSVIGATNFNDTSEDNFWLNPNDFYLEGMSPKQQKIFNRIMS